MSHFDMINGEELEPQEIQPHQPYRGNVYHVFGPYYSNPQRMFFFSFSILLPLHPCPVNIDDYCDVDVCVCIITTLLHWIGIMYLRAISFSVFGFFRSRIGKK